MSAKVTYMLRCPASMKRQIAVADDLRLLGIEVWNGMVLEPVPDPSRGTRKGKRAFSWQERLAFPTYLFAEMSVYDFHRANDKRDIWRIDRVPYSLEANLQMVQSRIDAQFRDAQSARERREAPRPAYTPGEVLEAVGGPLRGLMGDFREVVDDEDGTHVVVNGPMGRVKIAPQHVRKVG